MVSERPEFPSPCGEKVGINEAAQDDWEAVRILAAFPSPCGEKVGINEK